ncbi:hypothetical protein OROGR_000169 [Orobanche gracilis]
MDHQSYGCMVILVLFSGLTFSSNSSEALRFSVGGKCGWRLNPYENYNHWAARMRFQVNDTLLFKYKKGSDSVLLVNREDYHTCNTGRPKSKLDDGHSVFKLDRSGPFFFISGNKSRCMDGEKLIIVVLAVRTKHSSPPPPPPEAPCPITAPPSPAPGTDTSPSETPADQETIHGPSGSSTPRDENPEEHQPRRSYAVASWSSSVLLGSAVSVVISACLGGFINFI